MEEINHFSHQDHPLKFIENLEMIVNGDSEETHEDVCCYGCCEPLSSSGSAYGCIMCHFYLHKACAELEPNLNHHHHFQHPLSLVLQERNSNICDACDQIETGRFFYKCSPCDFGVCVKCAAAAIAVQKAANIKFEHEGHPHALTFQDRPAGFLCDACRTEDKDFFYRCNVCTFWIHKTCATLSPTIDLPHHHKHPLLLAYSLPDNFYNFFFFCEFCKKVIQRSYWVYHCANCRYFAHIKCALKAARQPPSLSNGEEEANYDGIPHFPMSNACTDPLKLHFEKLTLEDDEPVEINHWSHPHPLILSEKPTQAAGDNIARDMDSGDDVIEVCDGCVRPLSLPYYSCKSPGCSCTLHKYCVHLPRTLQHQLHPDHSLHLVDWSEQESLHRCVGCFSYGKSFAYICGESSCQFYLCVNCAFLPNIIKHVSHNHLLTQLIDPEHGCKACNNRSHCISYACKDCDFQLNMECAMKMPPSLGHRYCKEHKILFTYPPVDDHPEDFYCEICEEEMHPKFPLYYCHNCKNSFHLQCISPIDYFANTHFIMKTTTVSYHKHPLTVVRKKKTPDDVCSNCYCDINGYLILECRAKVCNFQICFRCHIKLY